MAKSTAEFQFIAYLLVGCSTSDIRPGIVTDRRHMDSGQLTEFAEFIAILSAR
jgi:hypothetical protein